MSKRSAPGAAVTADVAVAGVGTSDFRRLYADKDPLRSSTDLAAAAVRAALADAGLDKTDVDALLTSGTSYVRLADSLGFGELTFVNGFEGHGRMCGVAIASAALLIDARVADVVVCAYATTARSAAVRYGGGDEDAPYDAMHGLTSPGAYVALMFQRYRELYGVEGDALLPIAVSNRRNAARNPAAVMQTEVDEAAYRDSPFIAEPLRLLDYCIPIDGGVALVLTSRARAYSLAKPPVRLLAAATASDIESRYLSVDFFYAACRRVAEKLADATGVRPADVDVLQLYDAFTPSVLFALEGFGHCEQGESWRWIAEGRGAAGGERPINTGGGHTGEGYLQGWGLQVETVRQLRAEAGDRQVPGCNTVQYACAAPVVSSLVYASAA